MILRRTIFNCTVARFSQILKDSRFITDLYLPKKITDKWASKLIYSWNKQSLQEEEQKQINDSFYKTSLYVRILLLQTIKRSLEVQETEEAKTLYKEVMKRDWDEKAGTVLETKINKLIIIYESSDVVEENDFNFDEYIRRIESLQDKKDLSKIYLYQLPVYEEAALEAISKLKQNTENDA